MNLSSSFALSHSALLMLLSVLGAIAGMYFFFHGFSLLQQTRLASTRIIAQRPAHTTTITTTTTFTTQGSDSLKPEARTEIIQLSPTENPPATSTSMSQQGKIAAALLRAGIANPATMTDTRVQADVRVSDTSTAEEHGPSSDNEVSRALQKSVSAAPLPALNPATPRTSSQWIASLMIWGGPMLTLACIYLLAAHLGWL